LADVLDRRVSSRLISPSGDKTVTLVNHASVAARGRDHVTDHMAGA
jgi:hypothetical protein